MKIGIAGFAVVLLVGMSSAPAQDFLKMPQPTKEHEWLGQRAGEWESECEVVMAPGQPAVKGKGSESGRKLGGFWVIGEGKNEMMGGMKVSSVMTLGYDVAKKKYVGTWVDSMQNHMWKYEGTLDE